MAADANELWRTLLERERVAADDLLPPGATVVDAHTHLGLDIDGRSLALADHLDGMERYGVACSYVFALNEPDREPAYRAPNDRILRWAGESDGRLVPFARLSLDEEPLAEAQRCVDLGARGIKLHPRAQAFRVNDPRLERVFAFAAERRLPILIHAGRGLPPGMAEELAHVSDRYDATLILAHAAIADQGSIGELANGHPNIFFDTSTWTPLDLLALFARVGPEQVLYASDVPYGDYLTSRNMALRAMQHVGIPPEVQRQVLGETALGLIEGRRPDRLSPPAAGAALEVSYDRARVHTYLAAATPLLWTGTADIVGFLGLAAGACRNGDGTLEPVVELIAGAEAAWTAMLEADDALVAEDRRRSAFRLLHLSQARALLG